MKKITILLSFAILYGCRTPEKPSTQPPLPHLIFLNGEAGREIRYSKDPATGLCFAHYASTGFACVPCDSLKKLRKWNLN